MNEYSRFLNNNNLECSYEQYLKQAEYAHNIGLVQQEILECWLEAETSNTVEAMKKLSEVRRNTHPDLYKTALKLASSMKDYIKQDCQIGWE